MGKIGFACKLSELDPKKGIISIPEYNTGSTTISWLNRQTKEVAEQKLWDLMVQNLAATQKLVDRVGELNENLRMVRLSSDILPAYTQSDWSYFWRRPDVVSYLERNFILVGNSARKSNTRLSMHPGQFVVLASINEGIVGRSIEEFEYHADMARWLSFGKEKNDFKINVHIAGRQGPDGIRKALQRLSPEARNCITIENEENSWGLDDTLELAKDCSLVLDIHHHFIKTGEYIQPTDDRYLRVIDSWQGARPVIHYSYSRNEHLPTGFAHTSMPDMVQLLAEGCKKQKLRAHSDFYPNRMVNEWALSFLETADIMAESKGKNLASFELSDQAKRLGLV
jgi:UV DNA damage repair endonuclease